uniref:EamA/RhaT family transporter n=1 Tax=Acidicaldus sp. TaxID=1872105 RepID=A0A8J4HC06_9PROT
MPLWIALTFVAALFQTWRTALQQKLRATLSVNGASFVRFVYGVPFGLALLLAALAVSGARLPAPNREFLLECALAGALQIVGTGLLILAFGFRSFAVGSAYAKTEGVQTAIVAWAIAGETLRLKAWLGILLGVVGVLTLSLAGHGLRLRGLLRATFQPAALCGLGTGLCFAFVSVLIKWANLALHGGHPIVQALYALVVTNSLQTLMQGAWMAWREPAQLRAAFTHWRRAVWVGAMSAVGSGCWFSAFALAPVGLVRSLGQMEVPFILLFSHFYLKERMKRSDVAGLALVALGVILVLLGAGA